MMKKVCVASTNPVKLRAVETAFKAAFKTTGTEDAFEFVTVKAPSGVSDQPMGDAETLTGAKNRVKNARDMMPGCDFYCGLEGGCTLEESNTTGAGDGGEMTCFAWIVVQDAEGKREGKAKTGTFYLPPEVTKLVKGGLELGHANDRVFSQHNSKQQGGAVGLLTDGVITRHLYYEQTVILALIPFKTPDLYPC
ncbi:hypothetical protein PTSG_06820 [Salpingoeca rosetta]|uniref:inosine/xanthosine triphosphatase n=1 Tax=Salpingoeca rosetta (strain ATCC 50818 / BSB-021) TaxID=946362 RepID=F2UEW7_SALR5|nr:uncharacterized protein PTSG_06820 [Salpingoeca rosetta]EGD75167.1 hypothetical protein PTSG_06820 [Salpingoeca rosetta]|eukprot:XP_004992220.1 hypothetical protein PTSG_06820 [Salpingoeca rosetta]